MKPDFSAIARSGHSYNFHTHTPYCDSHDTIEAMVEAALSADFRHLGFTPHSPVMIESPCNMAAADMAAYRADIARAAGKAQGRISLYTGMEIDYLGPRCNAASPQYQDLGLDFSISSVHFIPNPRGCMIDIDGRYERFARNLHLHFGDDLRYVVETFFDQSMHMLATGGFDILGHFDKVALNASYHCPDVEQQGWYADLLSTYVHEIIASGVVVEINTKARAEHGRFFPHERLWPALVAADVTLVVNSDAHYAARLQSGRAEAFDMLESITAAIPAK